jgi:hypothetical protein
VEHAAQAWGWMSFCVPQEGRSGGETVPGQSQPHRQVLTHALTEKGTQGCEEPGVGPGCTSRPQPPARHQLGRGPYILITKVLTTRGTTCTKVQLVHPKPGGGGIGEGSAAPRQVMTSSDTYVQGQGATVHKRPWDGSTVNGNGSMSGPSQATRKVKSPGRRSAA